jgi:hypothetical protein
MDLYAAHIRDALCISHLVTLPYVEIYIYTFAHSHIEKYVLNKLGGVPKIQAGSYSKEKE